MGEYSARKSALQDTSEISHFTKTGYLSLLMIQQSLCVCITHSVAAESCAGEAVAAAWQCFDLPKLDFDASSSLQSFPVGHARSSELQ